MPVVNGKHFAYTAAGKNKAKKYAPKKLRTEAKPSAGLKASKKTAVAKQAAAGKDIGKKGKSFGKVASKAAKKYGSEETGRKVAAAAMWKNIKRGK